MGDADYLLRTWHPRTRPAALDLDDGTEWTGLEVHEAAGDEVLFTARYRTPHGTGAMTERSRFAQRGGRWVYVDGDTA
ncbi:YchJ family protein [Microbacterium petrolearium]